MHKSLLVSKINGKLKVLILSMIDLKPEEAVVDVEVAVVLKAVMAVPEAKAVVVVIEEEEVANGEVEEEVTEEEEAVAKAVVVVSGEVEEVTVVTVVAEVVEVVIVMVRDQILVT